MSSDSSTLIEFNDEYYARLIRLLNDPNEDATKELIKIRDLSIKQYELNGWIDEDTLKQLHAPLPVREKRKKVGAGSPMPSAEREPTSRQSSLGEDSLSPGVSRKEKLLKPETSQDSLPDVKESVPTKRKVKVESSSGEVEQPPSKKKAVKVFRDDPSIFGPLDPAPSPSAVKKKTVSVDGSQVKKLKKPKPRIIEQRLSKNTAPVESAAKPGSSKPSPKPVTADEVGSEFGLACVICNQISIERDNALVECQDCRRMYHQLCHNPPLAESEFTDPRVIWYCSSCSKPAKRSSSVKKTAEQSSSDESSNQGRSSGSEKPVKLASSGIASLAADFVAKHKNKVATTVSTLASTSVSQKPSTSGVLPSLKASPSGIARLAAAAKPTPKGVQNLSTERLQELAAERSTTKKKPLVQSPATPVSNKDKLIAADKRFHMMKKRAEMKQRLLKM